MPTLECLQSITIPIGGSMVLPAGAILVAADSTSTVNVSSECDSIDEQIDDMEVFGCYTFNYASDNDDNNNHPVDETTLTIVSVTIAGTEYTVNAPGYDSSADIKTALQAAVPQTIFKVVSVIREDLSKRVLFTVNFKTAPSIAATMEMKLTGTGYETGLYVKPIETEC